MRTLARRTCENIAWKMMLAAVGASRRTTGFCVLSLSTLRVTTRKGTSIEVTNSGSASLHHRMEAKASSARQFCLGALPSKKSSDSSVAKTPPAGRKQEQQL